MTTILDAEDVEIIKFALGKYKTKDKEEEAKVSELYGKFCDVSERLNYKGISI